MSQEALEFFSRDNNEAITYNLAQFNLFEEGQGSGKRAQIVFAERNGAPRITCFTGVNEPKAISFGFDPITFEMVLMKLEQVARSNGPVEDKVENMGKSKDGSSGMVVDSCLKFWKDEAGVVWLGVQKGSFTKNFKMTISYWHRLYRAADGMPMNEAESSVLKTIALVNSLRRALSFWIGRLRPNKFKKTGGKPTAAESVSPGQPTSSFTTDDSENDYY